MVDDAKSLFVGIKISAGIGRTTSIARHRAPSITSRAARTRSIFRSSHMGEDKFIGRYIKSGYPRRWDHGCEPQYLQYRQINCPWPPHRGERGAYLFLVSYK